MFFFAQFFWDLNLDCDEEVSTDVFLDMLDSVIFEFENLTMLSSCRNVDNSLSEDWNL